MPETKFSLPTFLRDHLVWVLGLVPLVLAALNILWISHGDSEVFAYLLQNLNLVALVLGTILPLISPAIVIISLVWLSHLTAMSEEERAKSPVGWKILSAIMIPFGMLFMQLHFVILTAIVIILLFLYYLFQRGWNKRSQIRYGVDVHTNPLLPPYFLVLALLLPMVSQAFQGSGWIPYEVLHLKDRPVSGQVLSADKEWTTFLDSSQHVQIVPTENVKSREPCYEDTFLGPTLQNVIFNRMLRRCYDNGRG